MLKLNSFEQVSIVNESSLAIIAPTSGQARTARRTTEAPLLALQCRHSIQILTSTLWAGGHLGRRMTAGFELAP